MSSQNLTIEEFNQLLQQWCNQSIIITKQELGDLDTVHMNLKDVTYSKDLIRSDDYEPKYSPHLNGEGTIETEPMPSDVYEIPIEDSTLYHFDQHHFVLVTERGTFTIERSN